jgi:ribosomal protein S21
MRTVVEITKNNNEAPVSLLRRFSRRVKTSGVMQKVRANRYYSRKDSPLKNKNRALNNIAKKKEFDLLKKLGKVTG